MVTVTLKSAPDLQRVIRAAFPGYKKHHALVSVFAGSVNVNSYWDGGSKDYYAVVDLNTMRVSTMPNQSHPYYNVAVSGLANQSSEAVKVDHVGNVELLMLPEGFALVSTGTFCGKPATAKVWLNAANMPKFILDGKTQNA